MSAQRYVCVAACFDLELEIAKVSLNPRVLVLVLAIRAHLHQRVCKAARQSKQAHRVNTLSSVIGWVSTQLKSLT